MNSIASSISTLEKVINEINKQKRTPKRIGNLLNLDNKSAYIIIGDIHGDLESLEKLFSKVDLGSYLKDNTNKIIFLGDYIDRGPQQLEVLNTVLTLYLNYPNQVVLLRGNHEGPEDLPCFPNDFERVILAKFKEDATRYRKKLQNVFDNLLTGAVIKEQALLVHGGIPTQGKDIGDIAYAHSLHPVRPHLTEILWNDPIEENGIKESPRGAGYLFGPSISNKFLDKIHVKSMIRGHQSVENGFKIDHKRLFTLFSSRTRSYRNTKRAALFINRKSSYEVEVLREYLVLY